MTDGANGSVRRRSARSSGAGGSRGASWVVTGTTVVVASAWALLLGLLTNHANLSAHLGPIDDHQVTEWGRLDGVLSWTDVWRALPSAMELSKFGNENRFRPGYGLVRLLEARLFGGHPGWWYLERTLLEAAVVTVLACVGTAVVVRAGRAPAGRLPIATAGTGLTGSSVVGRIVEAVVAVVFVTVCTGLESWNDIVTRLGPSELHAAVGIGMLVLGGYGLVVDGRARWWVLATVGVVVAVSAKENMAVLLLPAVAALAIGADRHDRRRWALAAGAVMVAAVAVVAAAVGPQILGTGTDVYGSGLGGSRLDGMVRWWGQRPPLLVVPAGYVVVVAVWAGWMRRVWRDRPAPGPRWAWVLLVGSFPVVQLVDGYVYGARSGDLHYQLLFDLAAAAELMTLVALVVVAVRLRPGRGATAWEPAGSTRSTVDAGAGQTGRIVLVTLAVTLVLSAPFLAASALVLDQRMRIAGVNRDGTTEYQALVSDLANELHRHPGSVVVLVFDEPWKVEPPRALGNELAARGVHGDQVYVEFASTHANDSGDGHLLQVLRAGNPRGGLAALPASTPRSCVYVYSTPESTPVPACDGAPHRSWFTGGWWPAIKWRTLSWRSLVPGL